MKIENFEQAKEIQTKINQHKRIIKTLIKPERPLSICMWSERIPYLHSVYSQDWSQEMELDPNARQALLNHYEYQLELLVQRFEAL